MVTFDVCDVKVDKRYTPPSYFPGYGGLVTPQKAFELIAKEGEKAANIEAAGGEAAVGVGMTQQGLVDATHFAFKDHKPLVLTPDSLWLTISQGVARHVTQNAEALRSRFVAHEGKKELIIRRDGFVRGSPANDWMGAFEEFSQKIRENTVPKTYERLISDFSTTGPLEKAISNLTLMDTVASYFSYGMTTCCGIPKFTLLGEPADWKKLYAKTEVLAEYDLAWWTKKMLPILEQFELAANGEVDKDFWNSFYNYNSGSGHDRITGHIVNFFPFIQKNDWKTKSVSYEKRERWDDTASDDLPTGIVKVPFTWYYHGTELKMFFKGGLASVIETPEGLKPACMWAVTD